jgi:hypothetical protein
VTFVVMLLLAANAIRYARDAIPVRPIFGIVLEGMFLALAFMRLAVLTFDGMHP